MSVVPMKLVTLTGPLNQFDRAVHDCVINQQFHPEPVLQMMKDAGDLRPFALDNPFAPLLRRAEALASGLGVQPEPASFEEVDSLSAETAGGYLDALEEKLEEYRRRREELEHQTAQAQAVEEQLKYLKGLSVDLHQLMEMEYVRFRYGWLPRETFDSFRESLHARENIFFIPTDTGPKRVYGIYFTTKAAREQADSLFHSLHFTRILLDERVEGSADKAFDSLRRQEETAAQELAVLQNELSACCRQESARFLTCWAYLRYHSAAYEVRQYAARSWDGFCLMGWVPEDCAQALCGRARQIPGLECSADDAEDLEHATPPTKLKRGFLARTFHPFLAMYGLPNYRELDPSLFLSVTYILFFGAMFGDIGQGLALALAGLYLSKRKKNQLGHIITCCGLSGAIFGCVYGSVFGFEDLLPGFKILHGTNVTLLLVLSLGLGALMIVFVMLLNIINGVKQKNWEKILFGPNGAAGMVFYLGAILAALSGPLLGVSLFTPAYILPALILPLALILLREPLSKLLAGDPSWRETPWGTVLGLGLFELFETLLSYLTNTLSFLRVAAYAITHVGLMLVVRALAGGGLNPVVLVLGNLFVIGFEGLLVGIQVLRLEFYELFGRFYQDGGLEYQPKVVDCKTYQSDT